MSTLLLSIPVLLVGAGLSIALRSNRAAGWVAILSQALATVLVLVSVVPLLRGEPPLEAVWSWSRPFDSIALRVDGLSAFFLSWSLPMTLLGTVYAVGYLQSFFEAGRRGGPHFALLNMISLSFVLVYSVQNALVFLLGWEIAAVAAWLLVIWDYPSQKIRFAGFNYLVSTHVGLFILVAAFMLLHGRTDSMDFRDFGDFLSTPGPTRATIFMLLGASFALKSAFFPFHTWLPRAHAAAPAHVSALMSGVIHKAGLFGLLRFLLLLGRPEEWIGWMVLGFGALSAFFGVMYTSTQRDLKRLLGYSSTENVGIVAMGFGIGCLGWTWDLPVLSACGFAAGLLHIFNHALFKCLLFYAAGSVYRAAHVVDIERLGGLAKKIPATAILFLTGALAIAALPPLNGFASELLLYAGLLSGSAPSSQSNVMLVTAAAALALVGGVSALSMTRAFGLTFLGSAREPDRHVGPDASPAMMIPMLVHAAGIVALGVAPELGLALVRSAVKLFPVAAGAVDDVLVPLAPVIWASRLLALGLLVAVGIGWIRGRHARRSVTWGCGYTAGSARMQYTGTAFTEKFATVFQSILPAVRREQLPTELLPREPGHIATHHPDAVERRMFEVLGQGEDFVMQASERIPEQPRFAFAAGLIALVIIGALLLGGSP
ncbi:MAG: proton-conducting transporter membrane subunit [Deltaproteobacteria bacterium]|nr:proton-conducting transporter membrane subunit [Deltaproteobacteria bacterium]